MSKTTLILVGSLMLILGQIFAWFLNNSQFVWDWWKDKPVITSLIWSFPVSLTFWWGSKWSYEALGTVWASRLLSFGLSYICFPLLTWFLMGESALTPKNIVSSLLAFTLVGIQVFWKG
jgi:hypothetical protein|tara:strand:+ start:507 stop:863 length:357 start_codon:yes stop_codon:yes gene_type:complete